MRKWTVLDTFGALGVVALGLVIVAVVLISRMPVPGESRGAAAAGSPRFKANTVACTSATALDQFIEAQARQDTRGQQFLLDNRSCLSPKADLPVSVLDRPSVGTVHVRAYVEGDSLELWTVREGLAGL